MKNIFVLLVFILSAGCLYGQHPQKVKTGVMDIKTSSGTESLSMILTDRLMMELAKTGRFDVVERDRRNEILKEHGFSVSGASDESNSMLKVGKLLSVSKIIGGSIGLVGETWIINISMFDVNTGRVEQPILKNINSKKIDGTLEYLEEIAKTFAKVEENIERKWLQDSIKCATNIKNLGTEVQKIEKCLVDLDISNVDKIKKNNEAIEKIKTEIPRLSDSVKCYGDNEKQEKDPKTLSKITDKKLWFIEKLMYKEKDLKKYEENPEKFIGLYEKEKQKMITQKQVKTETLIAEKSLFDKIMGNEKVTNKEINNNNK